MNDSELLNQDKTEILVIGAEADREKLSDHLKSFAPKHAGLMP